MGEEVASWSGLLVTEISQVQFICLPNARKTDIRHMVVFIFYIYIFLFDFVHHRKAPNPYFQQYQTIQKKGWCIIQIDDPSPKSSFNPTVFPN